MNFLSLEYFLVIAEERSFSGASAKLFVSQQALSEHVKKLEEELGAPLFVRGRGLTLTVAGECLVDGAREILDARTRLVKNIASVTSRRRSRITIGVSTFGTPSFLPELLTAYMERYPQFEAVVAKRMSADIARNMNGIDLYFNSGPLNGELTNVCLTEGEYYMAVAAKRFLEAGLGPAWPETAERLRQTGDLTLLRELPFINLYDRNAVLSEVLRKLYEHFGFTPVEGFYSESFALNLEMCVRGAGVMLLQSGSFRRRILEDPRIDAEALFACRIDSPETYIGLSVCYEKQKKLNPAEKSFLTVAREFFHP